MSILTHAFDLCKRLKQVPVRGKIQEVIWGLTYRPLTDDPAVSDRSHFGYIARQQAAQFLGYLIVDDRRKELEQEEPFPEKVPPVYKDELKILREAHAEFLKLNNACISTLISNAPGYRTIVDPYNGFAYSLPSRLNGQEIFSDSDIQFMAGSFSRHPAIFSALQNPTQSVKDFPASVEQSVWRLARGFEDAGPLKTPEGFMEAIVMHGRNSEQAKYLRFLMCLVTVRASLGVMNQLLFQALLYNKLPILNEDNIIEILESNATGVKLVVQPQDYGPVVFEPGNLVLIKTQAAGFSLDGLARCQGYSFEFSREFGESITVSAWMVDDNLNPYGLLYQQI